MHSLLAYAQLMPLPLTVSCFSKIQIGLTFLVPAHPGSPGKRAIKRLCVCFMFHICNEYVLIMATVVLNYLEQQAATKMQEMN